jgi:glycosyltransferase involved in cell wall biosynthesis
MPLLTIITPVYNRAEYLAAMLETVAVQAFTDYELIVVDDGSTDETPAVLAREGNSERWQGRLRVFRQDNAGPGAARNLALEHARGEYCTFLDSDDLLFPWSLSLMAEVIASEGRPPIVIGQSVPMRTNDDFVAAKRVPTELDRWPDLYSLGYVGATGSLIARTQAIKAVGGFLQDRIVGEDADLMIRLGTLKNIVRIKAPGSYSYRIHPVRMSRQASNWSAGALALIKRFEAGVFPGGETRRRELRKIISYNAAFGTFACVKHGDFVEGATLYLRTFFWQLRSGEYSYLMKMPFRLVLCALGLWPLRRADRIPF